MFEDIRNYFGGLEELANTDGDEALAVRIRAIRMSPDPKAYLRKALISKNRSKRQDEVLKQRVSWFTLYISEDGKRLSDEEGSPLASLTHMWELREQAVEPLKLNAALWTQFPHYFWEGDRTELNIIRRCYSDLQRMVETDPTRRKILLIMLSEKVEEQQKRIQSEAEQQQTQTTVNQNNRRPAFCLTRSLRQLTHELWPDARGDDEKEKRGHLMRFTLWGWKWRQLVLKHKLQDIS